MCLGKKEIEHHNIVYDVYPNEEWEERGEQREQREEQTTHSSKSLWNILCDFFCSWCNSCLIHNRIRYHYRYNYGYGGNHVMG